MEAIMNVRRLARLLLAVLALALGACSARNAVPAATDAAAAENVLPPNYAFQTTASGYAVVFRFPGLSNGAQPLSGLVQINAKLYGTTYYGGAQTCRYGTTGGCGSVFALQPASNNVTSVYKFSNGVTTGRNPRGNLLAFNGELYGTTYWGGKSVQACRARTQGCGVVFRVDPSSGKQEVVYAFKGGPGDGSNPAAGLVALNGTLYGVTNGGGRTCMHIRASCGTIFSIDPATSDEVVVHRFSGTDGANPIAALIAVGNVLYGTTSAGGSGSACPADTPGCGTVFRFDPSTTSLRTLYTFGGSPDGISPRAPLVAVRGQLYGVTALGGSMGGGVLFSIAPATGSERILYTFQGGNDGAFPVAGLVNANSYLYGTTEKGGGRYGNGTVFAVNIASGKERVLHRFLGGHDGANPVAALARFSGAFYGTTAANVGNHTGTIFSIEDR
jgi:uncharacterized repeat protein (TIGR03803 family)